MAKKTAPKIQCVGCTPWVWIILLILGIVFLLKDYAVVEFKATGWAIVLIVAALMGMIGAFARKK
jgi:hypothetical protein